MSWNMAIVAQYIEKAECISSFLTWEGLSWHMAIVAQYTEKAEFISSFLTWDGLSWFPKGCTWLVHIQAENQTRILKHNYYCLKNTNYEKKKNSIKQRKIGIKWTAIDCLRSKILIILYWYFMLTTISIRYFGKSIVRRS